MLSGYTVLQADEHRLLRGAHIGPIGYPFQALLWLQSGQLMVTHGRRRLHMRPGQILFRKAGEKITYAIHESQAVQGIYVYFKAPESWVRAQPKLKHNIGHPLTLQMMQFLADVSQAELGRSGAGVLVGILATLNCKARKSPDQRWQRLPSLVRRSVDLFREQPARKVSLNSLCLELGASPSTLCRQFRQSLGLAPLDVLRKLRLESAAQRLEQGDERIAEVAMSLGFANPFHFTRLFTAAYGLPPKSYRARAAKGVHRQWRLIENVQMGPVQVSS
jgi:AraC-like DNA-binding protein